MGLLYASLCSEYLASVLAQKSASLYLGDIIIIDLSVLRPTLSTGSWTVLYGCLSDPDRGRYLCFLGNKQIKHPVYKMNWVVKRTGF